MHRHLLHQSLVGSTGVTLQCYLAAIRGDKRYLDSGIQCFSLLVIDVIPTLMLPIASAKYLKSVGILPMDFLID